MVRSKQRGPLRTVAALVAVLAITTGWVHAATPLDGPTASAAARLMEASALAAHRMDRPVQPVSQTLAIHRAFQASLFASARPLFQARALANQPRATLPAPAPAAAPAPAPVRAKAPVPSSTPTYSGKNRFWMPALGISRSVYTFACTRKREPDNYVYRWGCAGRNNVYLLGHAWGVFKPLHDAYVRGRLKVGMTAIYADGNGRVRKYRITTWRIVSPVDAAWAIASQPVPSMTLQTCVGLDRLVVRLVAVN